VFHDNDSCNQFTTMLQCNKHHNEHSRPKPKPQQLVLGKITKFVGWCLTAVSAQKGYIVPCKY